MNTNSKLVEIEPVCPYLGRIGEHQVPSDSTKPRTSIHWDGRPLAVTVHRTWKELENVLPDWEDILRVNRELSIFSTPAWISSWWKAFGADLPMLTVAFRSSNCELVGLAPLYLADAGSKPFGKLKCLRLIGDGSGDSDNIDVIARPGFEQPCAEALLKWLANQPGWDICILNMLPSHSMMARNLSHQLRVAKWPLAVDSTPNAAIQLPSSWESFLAQLHGDFRPLVTRYPRRLANRYRVRIHRCGNLQELDRSLDTLFALHQKRWNYANESGSFGCAKRRRFYRLISESFLQKQWLELWLLEVNGIDVAAQFCFKYRDTAYVLQEGFDPNFGNDKVGYVLRAAVIRHLIDSGIETYDFLGGFNSHKQNWGARPGSYLTLTFAAPYTTGSYFLISRKLVKQGKEWLRQRLPSPAWKMLHWAKCKLVPPGAMSWQ